MCGAGSRWGMCRDCVMQDLGVEQERKGIKLESPAVLSAVCFPCNKEGINARVWTKPAVRCFPPPWQGSPCGSAGGGSQEGSSRSLVSPSLGLNPPPAPSASLHAWPCAGDVLCLKRCSLPCQHVTRVWVYMQHVSVYVTLVGVYMTYMCGVYMQCECILNVWMYCNTSVQVNDVTCGHT